jgi:hypothetical protein
MQIIHNMRMDIGKATMPPVIDAVQGDSNSRVASISLSLNGVAWSIPVGTKCFVRFRKPDGTGGIYDTMPDGAEAVSYNGNVVQARLAPEMLSFPGNVETQLELTNENTSLATFTFVVRVQADPSMGTKESKNYINLRAYVHEEFERILSSGVFPGIPSKLSELNNDVGFITSAVQDLVHYYGKDETYSKSQVNSLVSNIPKFSVLVVDALPVANISSTTIYLVQSKNSTEDMFTEYIYVNGHWEILGTQKMDLSGYLLRTELSEAIDDALAQAKESGEFDGAPGDPGISPVVDVEDIEGGHRVTITDKDGAKAFDVMDGKDGAGGGTVRWDDVKEKPVEVVPGSDTLTWNGNTQGLLRVEIPTWDKALYYKVSDDVPEWSDILCQNENGDPMFKIVMRDGYVHDQPTGNDEFIARMDDVVQLISNGECTYEEGMPIATYLEFAFCTMQDNVQVGEVLFPEKGVYFRYDVESLWIRDFDGFGGGEKFKPSHLYQPDWKQFNDKKPGYIKNKPVVTISRNNMLTWDGDTDGLLEAVDSDGNKFYKVSDVIVPEQAYWGRIEIGDTSEFLVCQLGDPKRYKDERGAMFDDIGLGNLYQNVLCVPEDNYPVQGYAASVLCPEKGVYFRHDVRYFYTPDFYGFPNVEKFDPDYLYQSNMAQNDPSKPDYVRNRTHYEQVSNEVLNLAWDGNTDGLLEVTLASLPEVKYYKVSDDVFSNEDILKMTLLKQLGQTTEESSAAEYHYLREDYAGAFEADIPTCMFIRKPCSPYDEELYDFDGTFFPEAGVYFFKNDNAYAKRLTTTERVERRTVKKLPEQYLSGAIFDALLNTKLKSEEWVFTLEDGREVKKAVYVG